ncbi:GNAT family N-acetyltransferase [Streptomyces sp. MUM 178J]|uniref:GNAT family N-acetyltransferase n=1 Tax=Streptomyces sp. MUM 178J TaxID=2791991 RepID=UPI001F04AF80|nr:GNAT family N-acetyltransferase [Streptomyces sp. MUM 178J]WRQ83053.1 GNAT family N-acetyltransferase [Streptomyces sp. MUM 178J]
MDYVIRAVQSDEWVKARELRLAALQDPVAPLAFLETYENAIEKPDAFWQERTARVAAGGVQAAGESPACQFIGEAPDGTWGGSLTVLVEPAGTGLSFAAEAKVDQAHVVGVYVRPDARGSGLADALFRAAIEWSWALSKPKIERVRLYVHEHNTRAAAFYRRVGFVASGEALPTPDDAMARELEYEIRRPPGL